MIASRVALAIALVIAPALVLVPGPAPAAARAADADPDPVERACAEMAPLDLDSDGVREVESLAPLGPTVGRDGAPLVLVLVEARLLEPVEGGSGGPPDLLPALRRHVADLALEGFRARLVAARVYAGPRHQDGRTVLALRRFFQRVRALDARLGGAVLVGSFPEAFLVRTYNWRKHGGLVLHQGTPREKRFENVPFLATIPEPVAMTCDLVISDLDGEWERLYVEARQRIPWVIGVYPGGVPARGGTCADFERGARVFEDYFHVNDGRHEVREVLGPDDRVVALDIEVNDEFENRECAPADLARPNPMAIPDIVVSRINARGVALRPRAGVRGVSGEGLLDASGRPQAVRFADEKAVPHWMSVWEPDPALERRLLVEYLDRNHRYRRGDFAAQFKPAAIGHGLGRGFGAARGAAPSWSDFAEPGLDGGDHATVLDVVSWLKRPAAFRDLRAHTDFFGAAFGAADVAALTAACGGTPWSWVREGDRLIPSLAPSRGKLDFPILKTLYENRVLPEGGAFYYHTGCDSISPVRYHDRPYDHPEYGYWQGAAGLLFYANGLALVGRAKVFYDAPRGFHEVLAAGGTFGEAWARYFEVESEARTADLVGGGIGRKRAYFWSAIGDWTLRLRPGPRVELF